MKDMNHDWEQYQFELNCEPRRQDAESTKTEMTELEDEIKPRVRSQSSHSKFNPRFVVNVMVILPKLCRIEQNWYACVLAPFWEFYFENQAWYSKWQIFDTS